MCHIILYTLILISLCALFLLPFLHSFPTRRSSDLFIITDQVWKLFQDQYNTNGRQHAFNNSIGHIIANNSRLDRSVEHTSELQSPCNLVCRLLIAEKTKYQDRTSLGV